MELACEYSSVFVFAMNMLVSSGGNFIVQTDCNTAAHVQLHSRLLRQGTHTTTRLSDGGNEGQNQILS
jgi:hypothetical protein